MSTQPQTKNIPASDLTEGSTLIDQFGLDWTVAVAPTLTTDQDGREVYGVSFMDPSLNIPSSSVQFYATDATVEVLV